MLTPEEIDRCVNSINRKKREKICLDSNLTPEQIKKLYCRKGSDSCPYKIRNYIKTKGFKDSDIPRLNNYLQTGIEELEKLLFLRKEYLFEYPPLKLFYLQHNI
ncbi:MAG: hypothetical protein Q8Q54_04015 [Methylococcales bacterium]|nr:hypothetical protein [Methylococcales bacterium]